MKGNNVDWWDRHVVSPVYLPLYTKEPAQQFFTKLCMGQPDATVEFPRINDNNKMAKARTYEPKESYCH